MISHKIFTKKYLKDFYPSISTKLIQISTKNKWFNEKLKNLLQEKQKLFKNYCMIKATSAKANYNTARNKYFHALKEQNKNTIYYFSNNNKTT